MMIGALHGVTGRYTAADGYAASTCDWSMLVQRLMPQTTWATPPCTFCNSHHWCQGVTGTYSMRGSEWYPGNRGSLKTLAWSRNLSNICTESQKLVFFFFGSEIVWVSGETWILPFATPSMHSELLRTKLNITQTHSPKVKAKVLQNKVMCFVLPSLWRNPLHEKSVAHVAFQLPAPWMLNWIQQMGFQTNTACHSCFWHSWALCPWWVVGQLSFVRLCPSSSVIPHSRLHNFVMFNAVSLSFPASAHDPKYTDHSWILGTYTPTPPLYLTLILTQCLPYELADSGFWGFAYPSLGWAQDLGWGWAKVSSKEGEWIHLQNTGLT